jgi:hypothetical protein
VRGRLVLAVVADEIAYGWNDEINANPDKEVSGGVEAVWARNEGRIAGTRYFVVREDS